MWTTIEGLSADVVGVNVLSMLDLKDLVWLDSAVASMEKRTTLAVCFQYVKISRTPWNVNGCKKVAFLQWLVKRGLRLNRLIVDNHFREIIPLLVSSPTTVDTRPEVWCADQAHMDELEDALSALADSTDCMFRLRINSETAVFIRNAAKLRGHVTESISWNTQFTNAEDFAELVRGNHSIQDVSIEEPTSEAMLIVASLQASLLSVRISRGKVTDEQLAALGRECYNLQSICLFENTGPLNKGVVALSRGCTALRSVNIDCSVSDDAITALCTYCPMLESLGALRGFLTTPALEGLIESGAPLNMLGIGWNVVSAPTLNADATFLYTLLGFLVVVVKRQCAPTLEIALSLMTSLNTFIFCKEERIITLPYPAEMVARILHSCLVVPSISTHPQWVSRGNEGMWSQMFIQRSALRCLACESVTGMEFTDRVLLSVAENCKLLEDIAFRAAPTLTDAGITTLVTHCMELVNLHVVQAAGLTDATLYAASNHGRNLRSLAVEHCAEFTEEAALHTLCSALTCLELPDMHMSKQAVEQAEEDLYPRSISVGVKWKITVKRKPT